MPSLPAATRRLFSLAFIAALSSCASDPPPRPSTAAPPPAAAILVGPTFLVGPGLEEAAAVAIDDRGVIVSVHDDADLAPPGPRVQLPGRLAVPGLHDAHLHLVGIGQQSERADLVGAASPAEVVERVRAFYATRQDATVIDGRGWDQSRFPDRAFPTADDLAPLDDLEKPVVLTRVDGHAVWVNRAALELAGIDERTESPEGGAIHRTPSGEPSGILIDNAIGLVRSKLPPPSDDDLRRWLLAGAHACQQAGLVSGHDMGMSLRAWSVLQALDEEGALPLRVFVYLDGTDPDAIGEVGKFAATDRLSLQGVKLLADGAMGSRGAALLAPYDDDPNNSGLLLVPPGDLERILTDVDRAGGQVAVHAIGDRANRVVLDAVERAETTPGRRHRVEHAQLVHPADFDRFRTLGVVASMQPTHATSDMRWAEARVGAARVQGAYAWRTMLDVGVPLAFGSDAPVESHRPALGLYAAVTRADSEGQPPGGWMPTQKLTLVEAIRAMTEGAALAVARERELGGISPGRRADLTLFDADPRRDPSLWRTVGVAGTVVDGALQGGSAGPE